ncbi:LysM peptidoglycan-binding domain-containing protein [Chondrinema litorale]|uniref:LysM peptidoglycan-binding domain-containing protein n=1 Tax=Chondrinema litorale TaxID=2994555 RepID=UPI00254371D9|nr:LysM peptidoglycan-binding domain-containing protein [Chondrinema litorale]UZR92899.1 LysM peptidoglycan-binding domain-containing protein [Chondrinema litorale]
MFKRYLFLLISFLPVFSSFAQNTQYIESDSVFTVALPPGYLLPFQEEEAYLTAAEIEEEAVSRMLKFDTTSAFNLEQIDYNSSFIPSVSDEVIQDRLAKIENGIELNYHQRVRLFIDFFSVRKREFTLRMMAKKNIYFPLYEKKLAEHGLPDELKYLSIIESALDPKAVSVARAVGLWQFMYYTGKMYGLSVSSTVDERRDPEQATEAACKHLKYLYGRFNDWELAIAAYNCGEGNVKKAQRRTGKVKFWDIYERLPRETRSYLPQFVAMMYVMEYADDHNLIQDKPYYAIPKETIYVNQSIDLKKLADELMVCEDDLLALNPKFKYNYVPAGVKNYPINIPAARLSLYLDKQTNILAKVKATAPPKPVYASRSGSGSISKEGKYYYTVRRGDVLGSIAQRNGVGLSQLRAWNNIYSNKIYPGQKLVIYGKGSNPPKVTASNTTQRNTTTTSSNVTASLPKGKVHVVKEGDTLWGISNLYKGLTVEKIKELNNLKTSRLKVGQRLKLG